MHRARVAVLCGFLAAAAALSGCSSSTKHAGGSQQPSELNGQPQGGSGFQGAGLVPPQPRPSFTLTDTKGKPFAFGTRTARHPTLVFFGYTNCPDVCPATMADIHQALTKVPAALQRQTYVVFVSTDVKHDTAAVIDKWLSNFTSGVGATFVGLRGTQTQIDAAQAASHVALAEDGGQTHSAQVLLFGADDYARVTFLQSDNEAELMAHDLPLTAQA
ncbi:MAG: SCO family protein [Pseudonocardiales bacterium]